MFLNVCLHRGDYVRGILSRGIMSWLPRWQWCRSARPPDRPSVGRSRRRPASMSIHQRLVIADIFYLAVYGHAGHAHYSAVTHPVVSHRRQTITDSDLFPLLDEYFSSKYWTFYFHFDLLSLVILLLLFFLLGDAVQKILRFRRTVVSNRIGMKYDRIVLIALIHGVGFFLNFCVTLLRWRPWRQRMQQRPRAVR